MNIVELKREEGTEYSLYKEKNRIGSCLMQGRTLRDFFVEERWRRHGYGSYLLKEILTRTGGYEQTNPCVHQVSAQEAELQPQFWAKFGFAQEENEWVRRHTPDLTGVQLAHLLLRQLCPHPTLAVDATCGNGHDTEFLCRLVGENGRVLALDIQQQAVENTNRRLEEAGLNSIGHAQQADHALLAELLPPSSADCVLFNFGWLPGAAHEIYSTQSTSIPALEGALQVLRPGGVLSAVLYSGKIIGNSEKQAVLNWMRALSPERYGVIVCEFANYAPTAPLPCFVIKKERRV